MRQRTVFTGLMWGTLAVVFCMHESARAQDTNGTERRWEDRTRGEFRWGASTTAFIPLDGGVLTTECDCRYDNARGAGVSFAAAVSYRLDPSFALAARAGYRLFLPDYREQFQTTVFNPLGDERLVTFERRAEMTLQAVSVALFFRWDTHISRFYVLVGPSLDFLVSSSFKETERVLTPGIVYPQGGTNERLLHDGTLEDAMEVRKWSMGVEGAVGYTFSLGALSLSPEIGFRFPVNGFSPSHSSWKITEIRAGVTVDTPW